MRIEQKVKTLVHLIITKNLADSLSLECPLKILLTLPNRQNFDLVGDITYFLSFSNPSSSRYTKFVFDPPPIIGIVHSNR